MKDQIYYHNPRCSKSRQGLVFLEEKGIDPQVKLYLQESMTTDEILSLFQKTGLGPLEGMVRTKEQTFTDLALADKELSQEEWAKIIVDNPILLERPIFVNGDKACIGRPPTNIFEIL